jgi:hypothetical protein
MNITLELSPEIEASLRQAVARRDAESARRLLAAAAAPTVETLLSRPQAAPEDLSEKELLAEINRGLSAAAWRRYEELVDKRREERLTSDEHAELVATTDRLEEANVFRVQCLAELARRRQVTLRVLMDELGIKPRIYG